jgi:hypothetical protein
MARKIEENLKFSLKNKFLLELDEDDLQLLFKCLPISLGTTPLKISHFQTNHKENPLTIAVI